MRLTVILLMATFLNASSRGLSQNITFSGRDVPLTTVLSAIKKQTGFVAFYPEADVKAARLVTVKAENLPLEQFLSEVFKFQTLEYSVRGKSIFITPKPFARYSDRQPELSGSDNLSDTLIDLKGRVLDEKDQPLAGATVLIKNSRRTAVTDQSGRFNIGAKEAEVLLISYIGYETRSMTISASLLSSGSLAIRLRASVSNLEEAKVEFSTGFQKIPKERAAGSFAVVNQELIEKRVSTNILQRLEDYVPGLIFQRDQDLSPRVEQNNISIRGESTIFSPNQPLIVVDNFPYDGDIKNINPNDVKSVTILKDASAASIWGARAGNGVIVIETKSGSFNSKLQVSANAVYSIAEKPNAFHFPRMSTTDYVDAMEMMFNMGYFQFPAITNSTNIPPHIQTLIDRRDNRITAEQANQILDNYRRQDIRREYEKYMYQKTINRQVSLNLSGGSINHHFAFNAGFDDNRTSLVGNTYKRLTLDLKNTWKVFRNRLKLSAGINLIRSEDNLGSQRFTASENEGVLFPYTRFIADDGTNLPIALINKGFINNAMSRGFLDWYMYPVQEIGLSPEIIKSLDYRLNAAASYTVVPGLTLDAQYQYWGNARNGEQILSVNSYEVRNMINTFAIANSNGTFTYPVPNGDILDVDYFNSFSHNLRGQLHYNHTWGKKHELVALAGAEVRDFQSESRSGRYYGYNDDLGLSVNVDHVNPQRSNVTELNNQLINANVAHAGSINRFHSVYANASYTFDRRFTLTASGRRDASNIFGVETNNRVKPLWSAGIAWDVSRENFYRSDLFPFLKLRTTFGYNGNVNNTLTAYLTGSYRAAATNLTLNGINQAYVVVASQPNPNLRWEKVEIMNIAVDFATREKRLQGSLDFYVKRGIDLIGSEIFPQSSGVSSFSGNFANTLTRGVDLDLHSLNTKGAVSWRTDLNLSILNEKVTRYGLDATGTQLRNYGAGGRIFEAVPVVGKPLFALYSYHWAGLDPENGDPRGILKGDVSKDYSQVIASYTSAEEMRYHGPGRPPVFGALRNTISWKGLSLSFNISFRLGYYFRRPPVNYSGLTSSSQFAAVTDDYQRRWKQPGDEVFTDVPSFRPELTATEINNRQVFTTYSESLVEKGDHIRLQDLILNYKLPTAGWLPLKDAQIYIHANNLGVLWKASDKVADPDFRLFFAPQRTLSFGLRTNF